MIGPEKTVGARTGFNGRLLKVRVLDVELPDGSRSVREVIRHPGATAILAELPDGRLVFVRQYRKAVEEALLEIVAGTLEAGEDVVDCARRELREETGYEAESLTPLGVIVPAPGYSDERLHLFHARLRDERRASAPDADERLECVLLTPEEVETMIRSGRFADAKTLAAWLLWKHRGQP